MSIGSNDSSTLVTPTSEFESPFSFKRTGSIDPQEVRQPRFPGTFSDSTYRRGSAAGQHDLVIAAQKGLGPTVRAHHPINPVKATSQFDLQTQARYGLGPTVSYKEPLVEPRSSGVQHDLLSQAVYGHGPTVPVSQAVLEGRKAERTYDLSTQRKDVDLRDPWKGKKSFVSTGNDWDLSSQYRKFH